MHKALSKLIILLAVILQACGSRTTPKEHKNPYPDDYTAIASISHRHEWNTANVHDPSCIKVGDTYYVYATGAYYTPPNVTFKDDTTVHMGNIPVRSSKDLVNWEFNGWVFDHIPEEAYEHIKKTNNGHTPGNIWAPFIRQAGDEFRLYYSVSYFGSKGSYIGLATSQSPLGPWENKGEVVKTSNADVMNAIDASVITDPKTGKDWMMYGSYFGGLYCMELDPASGLAMTPGDHGHVVARRPTGRDRVIEAPELVYNADQDMYYLFISYDPLFTYYNIRVGRSKTPEGPFKDYFGNDLRDTLDNYPILTHSYKFNNHVGWSGNGHCAVINDGGKYYVMHQGRLAPENLKLRMMIREVKWLSDGWPVFSPERYNIIGDRPALNATDLVGSWELIELQDHPDQVKFWEGDDAAGKWHYKKEAFNYSRMVKMDGANVSGEMDNIQSYELRGGELYLTLTDGAEVECALFRGWDWENQNETILFSGILPSGHGLWGKKVR